MQNKDIPAILEAILYVSGDPVSVKDIAHALNLTEGEMEEHIKALQDHLDLESHGLRLNRYGGSVQLSIRSEFAPYIENLLQPVQKQSLSQSVLETLSIIAYKQPVTKTEIEQIRGVKCDYSVQLLMKRSLICEAGRKETLGRPVLYATTEEFLRHFGIEDLSELPQIEEITPPENGGTSNAG